MKLRPPEIRSFSKAKGPAKRKIVVDLFAGGGGWSLGVEMATGESPDVAVNHDPEALAMHKANHPATVHYQEDIYDVDPVAVCGGRPVGLLVMSPDCTEHSKAKNGSITRNKKVRSLARVAIDWARLVRPDIIILENVEEWWDWGPLDEFGKIDPARKGEYRILWWERLEALGYKLAFRVLKACDFGAPTSRKRLFIIARCDGVDPEDSFPEATHGPGTERPYRTAAECIDYTLPCPSIFMTKRQAKKFTKDTGIRCKRPLADKTMRRIRRGLYKYVLRCKKPFTVRLTGDDDRIYDLDEPMRTVTAAPRGEFSLVAPLVSPVKSWGGGGNDAATADRPLRTITTSKRGEFAVVAPLIQSYYGEAANREQVRSQPLDHPLPTQTTANRFAVIAPTLIQTGYGERKGQAPRCLDLHAPLGTVISGGNGNGNGKHALVEARLETAEKCAAWIYKGFGDGGKRTGGFPGGQSLDKPLGTITRRDHHAFAVSHMVKLRGTSDGHMDSSSLPATAPVPTISAGGNHIAEVRAFLTKYYGEGCGQDLGDPLHTITTRDRFGIVAIEGVDYQIVDIGMRMLEPRELYRAMGFPDSYIIDPIVTTTRVTKKGRVITKTAPLNKTQQVEKCGNAVCPPIACAIVKAALAARPREIVRAA